MIEMGPQSWMAKLYGPDRLAGLGFVPVHGRARPCGCSDRQRGPRPHAGAVDVARVPRLDRPTWPNVIGAVIYRNKTIEKVRHSQTSPRSGPELVGARGRSSRRVACAVSLTASPPSCCAVYLATPRVRRLVQDPGRPDHHATLCLGSAALTLGGRTGRTSGCGTASCCSPPCGSDGTGRRGVSQPRRPLASGGGGICGHAELRPVAGVSLFLPFLEQISCWPTPGRIFAADRSSSPATA